MTKCIFGTYRPERLNSPYNYNDSAGTSLNGVYHASMFLNSQFADWNAAWLTNVVDWDQLIPEERYTSEIVPGVKKLTRALVFEYNEQYVNPEELARSAENVWKRFDVDMLTADEFYDWIKANTSLEEVENRKFLISPESEFMGQVVPAKYLVIE